MAKGIRFHYLHRDSGNYKLFGHKDFSNPDERQLGELETAIREGLISSEFFYPETVGIRKFRFHRYADDYSWYEFEHIEAIEILHSHPNIEELITKLTHP